MDYFGHAKTVLELESMVVAYARKTSSLGTLKTQFPYSLLWRNKALNPKLPPIRACECVYVSMFIYMCIYLCIHACVHMHPCICIYMCVCIYMCLCVCIRVSMYMCVYMCLCVCLCVSMYMFVCVYMYVFACTGQRVKNKEPMHGKASFVNY